MPSGKSRGRLWARSAAARTSASGSSRAATSTGVILSLVAVLVIALAGAVLIRGADPQAAPAGTHGPTGIPGQWTMIFEDSFEGTKLSSAWCPGWFGKGVTPPVNSLEDAAYSSSHVTLPGGGAVHLSLTDTPITVNGDRYGHTGALLSTNPSDGCHGADPGFQFTHGAVEFRAWLPASAGGIANWPALWATGQDWPEDGEIDVMEGLGGDAAVHYKSSEMVDSPDNGVDVPGKWTEGWHTFAATWEHDRVTYYYDGKPVWTITEGIADSPLYLVIDYTINESQPATPATMKVDYVRVWQRSAKVSQP